jgi:ABC-type molybdate transport system substrate-binding protein
MKIGGETRAAILIIGKRFLEDQRKRRFAANSHQAVFNWRTVLAIANDPSSAKSFEHFLSSPLKTIRRNIF